MCVPDPKMLATIFKACLFLAGASLLGVGVWMRVDSGTLLDILTQLTGTSSVLSKLANFSYLLIAMGAVLLFLSFLGLCGAVGESRCMLTTFFTILLIMFIIKVAGAVVLLILQNVAKQHLHTVEKGVIKNFRDKYGSNKGLTSIWDSTMNDFACCGYRNYTDIFGSPFNVKGNLFPSACCNSTTKSCTANAAGQAAVVGCLDKILKLIRNNATTVAGVAIGVIVLEIAAMVVSCFL